jgi:hypothetical protein
MRAATVLGLVWVAAPPGGLPLPPLKERRARLPKRCGPDPVGCLIEGVASRKALSRLPRARATDCAKGPSKGSSFDMAVGCLHAVRAAATMLTNACKG